MLFFGLLHQTRVLIGYHTLLQARVVVATYEEELVSIFLLTHRVI